MFGAKADQWLAPSSEGSVEYELPGKASVSVVWSNPFGFLRSEFCNFLATNAVFKGKSSRSTHAKGYLLEARATVSFASLTAGVNGGGGGGSSPAPPVPRRRIANSSFNSSGGDNGTEFWRNKLVGAQRCMIVTLLNNSDVELTLESHDVGPGSVWSQHPPDVVGPKQRTTVAAYTRGMGGTSGTLVFAIKGYDRRLLLIWDNPRLGPNMKQFQCPEQFAVTMRMVDRSISGLVITFARKTGGVDALINDEPEDMEWFLTANASPAKPTRGSSDDSVGLSIFSMACALMPPPLGSGDPNRRAHLIAESLKESPYTCICLQEVFWSNAQEALRRALLPHFPYIIDRSGKEAYGVGVTAGLFFASKSPIEFSQFFPFEVGIGSDSLASKGVLLIKIKKHNFYVAMTDMQSDPDGSIPWKLQGNSKSGAAKVRLSQAQMIARMLCQTIGERERQPASCGLAVVGVMHLTAERRVRNEQEQWATSTLIPHLADLLNAGKLPVVYASELLGELKSRGFQIRFLGQLRAATTEPRIRSLLLVIMIARLLQQELWDAMRGEVFPSKEQEQKRYVELCLRYLEAISGLETIPARAVAVVHASPIMSTVSASAVVGSSSSEKVGSSSSLPVATAASNVKGPPPPRPLTPAKSLSGSGSNKLESSGEQQKLSEDGSPPAPSFLKLLLHGIWHKELVRQINVTFGPLALNDPNEVYVTFLRAEVSWFQLLRYQEELLGVHLVPDVEIELLRTVPRALEYPDDVNDANMDLLQLREDWEADQKLQIEQTEEFKEMLRVFGQPHDVFREANENDFGSDGTILQQEEVRRHHVLVFDKLPDGKELLKMPVAWSSRPLLMGDSGALTDILTVAPANEAVLVPVVDGFELV